MSVNLAKDEHQRLVKKLINYFESLGLIVTCSCYGHVPCPKMIMYEPDVRARDFKKELNYIGEAKLCDDLQSKYTKEQIREFANRIMTEGKSSGKNVPFYITTSDECKDKLQKLLEDLGISNKNNVFII